MLASTVSTVLASTVLASTVLASTVLASTVLASTVLGVAQLVFYVCSQQSEEQILELTQQVEEFKVQAVST